MESGRIWEPSRAWLPPGNTNAPCSSSKVIDGRRVIQNPKSKILSLDQDRLRINLDVHVVRDDDPAPVERAVPVHSEVFPVDPGLGDESGAGFRPLVHAVLPPPG